MIVCQNVFPGILRTAQIKGCERGGAYSAVPGTFSSNKVIETCENSWYAKQGLFVQSSRVGHFSDQSVFQK